MYRLSLFLLLFVSSLTQAAYSQDSGQVSRIYVNPHGSIAVLLKAGYPNARSSNQCPQANGWAGLDKADPAITSVILAAQASGRVLTVTIEGCISGWYKIKDLYLD